MIDQYFGVKELYEVVLKAKNPMTFGSRRLEEGEPVLYFENVNISMLTERRTPVMARGGWSNMPRVIWEDSSEVQFSLSEGVMSSISMAILLSSSMTERQESQSLLVQKREGPFELDGEPGDVERGFYIKQIPYLKKKVFIYEYERNVAQRKVYGDYKEKGGFPYIYNLYYDKEKTIPADPNKEYIIDYYYEYKDEALIYLIQKERFNGLFTLEGKFYSKDENDGLNYTNLIYMPKVRVVSDINLRLGERADPTTSVFNIVGMPEKTDDSNNLIVRITRLNQDIDAD